MNFLEAYRAMIRGEKVRQVYWAEENFIYMNFVGNYCCVFDEESSEYTFRHCDYLDESWELYEEKPKLHTFEEAITALKSGKAVRRRGINWTRFSKESVGCISLIVEEDHRVPDRSITRSYLHLRFSIEDMMANDWEISE